MTARVANIWRHPIKAHGVEALTSTCLKVGETLPYDRHWAVTDANARLGKNAETWAPCINFSRGAKSPALMAITATLETRVDGESRIRLTLRHPDRPDLNFNPDLPDDTARFLQWVAPLVNPDRPFATGIIPTTGRGMTDTNYASVSILSRSSLGALTQAAGQPLSQVRWRGNIWLEGLKPWAETEMIGKTIKIGKTILRVVEPIGRCRATSADPTTGQIDIDTLGLLRRLRGNTQFGVYAEVLTGGPLALGDPMTVIGD